MRALKAGDGWSQAVTWSSFNTSRVRTQSASLSLRPEVCLPLNILESFAAFLEIMDIIEKVPRSLLLFKEILSCIYLLMPGLFYKRLSVYL